MCRPALSNYSPLAVETAVRESGGQLLLFPESWTSSQVGLELEFVCLPAVGAMPRMYGRSNERGERPSKWWAAPSFP